VGGNEEANRLVSALPGYEYVERIGVDSMAETFLAWQSGPGGFRRQVAIKHILAQEDPDFPELFRREATVAASLSHPNIVSVLDVPATAGGSIVVMEYVCGRSLRDLLHSLHRDSLRIPMRVASYVAASVCDALHHAHHATGPFGEPLTIVHGDISPGSILIDINGHVKLTDFGVARCYGVESTPRTGVVRGSLAYMSPEHARGERLDQRSDLFSLGAVLYEMATGTRPFAGHGAAAAHAILAGELVTPSRRVRDIDPVMGRIIERALANERRARYPLAEIMADDLRLLDGYDAQLAAAELATLLRRRFPELARHRRGRSNATSSQTAREGPLTVIVTRSRRAPPACSPAPARSRSRVALWLAVATLVSAAFWITVIVAAA
jgi:serine/threonine-protein kinase